ncbi:hypothetical protein HCN44_009554 [Aphidius gifuensis]|uniref:Ribosome-recycling factor, mitochondrial n=1 Tax=Aphidius gifuensis TaxID=684658 RepID=A0A834Y3Z5_APHGI|nr:ribosome-recycling factor, mitochondrial [Aphidius gifuensis]KAF7998156.1 hypothetical protein HCN44_009554 [Aphidius gifuensis]
MRNLLFYNLPKLAINKLPAHLNSQTNITRYFSIISTKKIVNNKVNLLLPVNNNHVVINKNLLSLSCVLLKAKDKGDKKKSSKAQHINLNEISEFVDTDKFISQMDHSIEELKNNFIKHLTLRSSAGSIEQISVNFEGEEFMLQELVQIVRKPKMIVLNVTTFPQALPQIIEALEKSGMNLNPQQDGTTLFVPLPKVTKEHREGLAKNAKAIYIKCRDNLKDIKNKELKNLKKKTSISEDQVRRVHGQLEAICEKYIKDADVILDTKQKDLLKTE